jgi:hypothetical protein
VGDPPEAQHAASFITDSTGSSGRFHLFLVRNAGPVLAQELDPAEDITVEEASLPELRRYVRDGTIDTGYSVASIYHILDRLGKL